MRTTTQEELKEGSIWYKTDLPLDVDGRPPDDLVGRGSDLVHLRQDLLLNAQVRVNRAVELDGVSVPGRQYAEFIEFHVKPFVRNAVKRDEYMIKLCRQGGSQRAAYRPSRRPNSPDATSRTGCWDVPWDPSQAM